MKLFYYILGFLLLSASNIFAQSSKLNFYHKSEFSRVSWFQSLEGLYDLNNRSLNAEYNYRLDSTVSISYPEMRPFYKHEYHSNGKETISARSSWDNEWLPDLFVKYLFNSEGLLTEVTTSGWNGSLTW